MSVRSQNMVWWNPFSWKKKEKASSYTFTDEDRQRSAELKKAQADLRRMQLQKEIEINKLEADIALEELRMDLAELRGESGEEDKSIEGMFAEVFKPVVEAYAFKMKSEVQKNMLPLNSSSGNVQTPPTTNSELKEFSDEELLSFWNDLSPFEKEMAKNASDDKIRSFVINEFPDIKQEQIAKIIKFVHEKEIET